MIEQLEKRFLLTTYYVGNAAGDNGSDSNAGTVLTAPFLTISKAATVAKAGDTVDILAGTYRETVTPTNSGTASAPITYQAYNNQKVVIDGANPVTGWTQYSGNIYQSSAMNWTMGGQDDQVFVDGVMMNYARWPNTSLDVSRPTWAVAGAPTTGSNTSASVITNTIYDANLTQPAGYWNGATIHIEPGETWIYEAATITSYTRATVNGVSYGVITYTSSFSTPSYFIAAAGNPYYITGDPYFTAGSFQDLDEAGTFYRASNTGELYLWTPAGDSPANHVIEAKQRMWGFNLSGLSYVNITGISLFACSIDSSATSSHLLINGINAQYVSHFEDYNGNWSPTLGSGLPILGTTGIVLDGAYDEIENSTIAFSAGDGIYLGGSNATVYNNVVHDVDYSGINGAGIDTAEYVSTEIASVNISNNTVYNSARALINVSDLSASRVDYNLTFNASLQGADVAPIYGYDAIGNGSEIDHNVIYNSQNNIVGYYTNGIFLDDFSTGYTIDHNVISNVGQGIDLFQTGTVNVFNNTIDDAQVSIDDYGTAGTIANNVTTAAMALYGQTTITITNNLSPPTVPGFVSESTSNFQLLSTSPAINAGKVEAPYTNGYLGSAPDEGAYEYGATAWTAGASNTSTVLATAAVPAPLTSQDIGSPQVQGSAAYSNGVFAVTGDGSDIWGTADQFQYVDAPVTGDQTMVARVTYQTDTYPWAKAGVMFRTNTSAGSAFVMVADTPSFGVSLVSRDGSGNLASTTTTELAYPVWVKLVRAANLFTGYESPDGVNWTSIGSITIVMPAAGLIGLAVSSHVLNMGSNVGFDDVSLTLPTPTGLTATTASTSQINLSWSTTTAAIGYLLQRSTDNVNFTTIATLGAVTSYSDTGLTANTNYYYRLIAINAIGSSSPATAGAFTSTAALAAPTGFTATASFSAVALSWNAVANATSYKIYRGITAGGESTTPISTAVTGTTYSDGSAAWGNKYYYYVTASTTGSLASTEISILAGATTVPAVVQAENYDYGGQGVAYSTTLTNNPGGAYRSDAVGIEPTTDTGGGYDLGYTAAGEWLDYTISVPVSGYFTFTTRVASPSSGGAFHIAIDLVNVTGSLVIPNTGGWQTWTNVVSAPVFITAGIHVMRLSIDAGNPTGNFNYITLASVASSPVTAPTGFTAAASFTAVTLNWTAPANAISYNIYRGTASGAESVIASGVTGTTYVDSTPTWGTKYYYYVVASAPGSIASSEVSILAGATTVPAVIQAENYDYGGQGVGYSSPLSNNPGGAYRTDDVGIESTSDTGGGYDVAYTEAGEWLDYTISVPTAGYFTFNSRVASYFGGGVCHIDVDQVNVTGPLTIPNTGGWQNWTNLISSAVYMTVGTHVLRLSFDSGGSPYVGNFNYITIASAAATTLSAPTGVTATPGLTSITLNWNAASGATSYNVYRATSSGGEGTTPYATVLTGTTYTDTAALEGQIYYYDVTALPPESAPSPEVSATATAIKLTGTPIGTQTSYANSGDTIAQVFDGNFNTFYDAPNGTLTNWIGLDMGWAQSISEIQYAPRATYESRMIGGQFQVSNSATFASGVVNLYTIATAPTAGQFTDIFVSPGANYRYVRYVGGTNWVNIAEIQVDGAVTTGPIIAKLTGTPMGTATSWLNNGDTIAQVFDGNFNSYFDAPNSSLTNWAGLDLGSAQTVFQIKYAPRTGYESRMLNAQFQVSNSATFATGVVTLYTIFSTPVAGQFTDIFVNPGGAYRYIRYVGGTTWVNIAEMEVDDIG